VRDNIASFIVLFKLVLPFCVLLLPCPCQEFFFDKERFFHLVLVTKQGFHSQVRKCWSPPLIAWKYVKTSGQQFFSYRTLGRSVCASQVNKIIHSGCACFRFPSFVDSHHGHVISANLNILSRPSLIELFLEALSSEVASCLCCLLKKLLLKVFTSLSTSKRASRSSRDMKLSCILCKTGCSLSGRMRVFKAFQITTSSLVP
jgi:hypothetical protein